MTGPDHYCKAEELTQKAHEYLGQGDGQESAAVWAAVAQIHATLALAAATALGMATAEGRAWAFIARPAEYGPHQARDLTASGDWDLIATSITDLARRLMDRPPRDERPDQ